MELIDSLKGYLLLAVLIITGMCHTNNITQSDNICTLNSKDVFLEAVGLRTCILTPLAVNDVPNSKLALQSSYVVWAISELDHPNVYTRSSPIRPSNTTSLKSFQTWNFAPKQILPAVFPVEEEEGNFIRRSIPNVIFSKAYPSPLRTKPLLAAYSKEVIQDLLDIDPDRFGDCSDFLQLASGSVVHNNHPIPLAHRYGGHQFGFWAGQLGDGRAHLLGEYVNDIGEHWELQLKGSGKTPYSRDGDGRAVIRSSVREFLCSEAMHYLGIPSSRTASLVVSEDIVWRDQFYNGNPKPEKAAVVLRVAKSWFRIGSLEILSQNSEIHELKLLVDFIIKKYFLMVDPWDLNKYLRFFSEVVSSTSKLIALWQSVGFAHGVMNTDNFSILPITIDYGPFGFLDEYDPKMVPNTSDDEGMYRFEKQPDVAKYNMNKLRMALSRLLSADQQRQAQHILDGFDPLYKTEFMNSFRQKFGLVDQDDNDQNLVATWLKILEDLKGDYTMCFRQLGEWSLPAMESGHVDQKLWALNEISHHKSFQDWVQHYLWRIKSYNINDDERRRTMQQINPRYILRNWIAQKAITQTENGDFSFLNRIHTILKHPYLEQKDAESAGFADRPPLWAKTLRVSCSS